MHSFTCWTLFISGINRAWLYKGWQLKVEHWPNDREVLVSIPTGGNVWRIFLLFPLKIAQIIWQKRLLWKTHMKGFKKFQSCPKWELSSQYVGLKVRCLSHSANSVELIFFMHHFTHWISRLNKAWLYNIRVWQSGTGSHLRVSELDKYQTSKWVNVKCCKFHSHCQLYFCWNLLKSVNFVQNEKVAGYSRKVFLCTHGYC